VLILLLIAPGGVAQGFYGVRDSMLRWIAARHGILVPSLTEDRRVAGLDEARAGEVHSIQDPGDPDEPSGPRDDEVHALKAALA
jgi:hypothetical protein